MWYRLKLIALCLRKHRCANCRLSNARTGSSLVYLSDRCDGLGAVLASRRWLKRTIP
jgi:hypothetical protein